MARGADGSMMTESQLKELNRQRFLEAVSQGNLYNTGPMTNGGGTSFGEDRWAAYFEANPDEAPSDWTGDSESYVEKASDTQEFVVDKNEIDIRDEEDMTPSHTGRGKDNSFLTEEQAQAEVEPSLADEVKTDITMEDEISKETDDMDTFDTTVEGWTTQFMDLSDEDFKSAALALDQLPDNAKEAYNNLVGTRDDIAFEDGLSKARQSNQDKINAITDETGATHQIPGVSVSCSTAVDITCDFPLSCHAFYHQLW